MLGMTWGLRKSSTELHAKSSNPGQRARPPLLLLNIDSLPRDVIPVAEDT
ncbi:hypothetical protein J2S64_002629 [Paeniglutamicibacter sulfureus]|uniref:Uncharacterized protein n=1 Tax=Paeniglutamicibacter sulfureus TaxID=43666 RepID=A0ABU2BJY8_9MICC|nr:hypothetical protein [Paeniglutamicibacter sulfureus]